MKQKWKAAEMETTKLKGIKIAFSSAA